MMTMLSDRKKRMHQKKYKNSRAGLQIREVYQSILKYRESYYNLDKFLLTWNIADRRKHYC